VRRWSAASSTPSCPFHQHTGSDRSTYRPAGNSRSVTAWNAVAWPGCSRGSQHTAYAEDVQQHLPLGGVPLEHRPLPRSRLPPVQLEPSRRGRRPEARETSRQPPQRGRTHHRAATPAAPAIPGTTRTCPATTALRQVWRHSAQMAWTSSVDDAPKLYSSRMVTQSRDQFLKVVTIPGLSWAEDSAPTLNRPDAVRRGTLRLHWKGSPEDA
jgi:hypothetical protein